MEDFSKMSEDFLQNLYKVIKIYIFPFQSPIAAKPLEASGEAASTIYVYNAFVLECYFMASYEDRD